MLRAFSFPALLSLLVALGGPGFAVAQGPETAQQPDVAAEPEADPPGRVARLSFISGDVSFQSAEAGSPEDAVLNHPVTSGDRLLTGPKSRAELTMGVAAIRADENTDLSVAVLDDDLAQFVVNSGTVSIRVREIPSGTTFEVDTPQSAIRLLERGEYRVDVTSGGAATLAVREGDAEIDTGSGPVRVGAR
ncbi:MAG TPA: FecR domain-containing protein, partial [Steroidobacteraceae bacterium]